MEQHKKDTFSSAHNTTSHPFRLQSSTIGRKWGSGLWVSQIARKPVEPGINKMAKLEEVIKSIRAAQARKRKNGCSGSRKRGVIKGSSDLG